MAKIKKIQSANFKRNTLTMAAVFLFSLIVLSEIVLAVSIPWYLTRENTMAREVLQINLRNSFDHARRLSAKANSSSEVRQAEMRLVKWALDSMAEYLRDHADQLEQEDLKHIQSTIDSLVQIANRINSRKSYSVEQRLDTGLYINSLLRGRRKNVEER